MVKRKCPRIRHFADMFSGEGQIFKRMRRQSPQSDRRRA